MVKYKILGIVTDTIRRNGKVVTNKDGSKRWGAIGWYRIVNPLSKLGANIEIGLGVSMNAESAMKLKSLGDIWVCKMADNENIDFIYGAHKEFTGCKFVLDLDDEIDNIDPTHPDYHALEDRKHMRIRMTQIADHVICATEQIKDAVSKYNPYCTVIPNSIDPAIWKFDNKKKNDGKIRIGWMSSGSHFVDSPIIEDIMVEICEEFPNVEFHIAGMIHNDTKGKNWYHHKGTYGYKLFPKFYASLGIDIAIAPLKDIPFNRCKSNIKYLEASMLGIPTVASDVAPYQCIKHGETGYLASNPRQFKKYLVWLIKDAKKRIEMGERAKKYTLENWTIDKFLHKYVELFDKLMDKKDITVVTAIAGGKDTLKKQPEYKGVKYVAFVDEDVKDEQWETHKVCDKFSEPVMNAKIHKILTHKYIDTPYIMWIDGSVTLKTDPHELIKVLGDKDIAAFKHPGRDCVYDEAEACVQLGKGKVEELAEQVKNYAKEMYPANNGLFELTAFFRRNDKKINDIFEKWWVEITRYSNRDQISFPYVLGKTNYAIIQGSVEKDPTGQHKAFPGNKYFDYSRHLK